MIIGSEKPVVNRLLGGGDYEELPETVGIEEVMDMEVDNVVLPH